MKLPQLELNPADTFFGIFVMDVLRPVSYLAGLLNRMDIKAIAASPSFAMRTRNHEARTAPCDPGVD
jgi:hypothetical protein